MPLASSASAAADSAREDDEALGRAVRRARQAQGLSLKCVAARASLSVGGLSQIERGISSPSVRSLRAICDVIGVPVHALFGNDEGQPETDRIVRAGRRRRVDFGSKGMVKEFLNARDDGALQVMEIALSPGGGSGEEPYTHDGEECGVVLQGALMLEVDGRRYSLSAGDAFTFESTLSHRFANEGEVETRVIWITTPPVW
ncbi:cupin domain-containing protein [Pararhizobium mangrovi]|uniref:Cupin domain-containing protein n=2 Tax=Pararhizobium mangrovi TaxID=2590452 RepID=A0A506U1X1_9HYPH|nr:cupin domain-containing protein [Pararhizobium mangrovi]